MLAGKIRKTVYVKHMVFGKIAALQLLQQPIHLISWVTLSTAAKTVIGAKKQRKLLQLLRQSPLGLAGCKLQILRADAAALEFIHRVHKLS